MSCVHHWRIDEPNGPTSPGSCLNCGASRLFANHDFERGRIAPLVLPGNAKHRRPLDFGRGQAPGFPINPHTSWAS